MTRPYKSSLCVSSPARVPAAESSLFVGRFGEHLVPSSWVDISRYTSIASSLVGVLDVTEGLGSGWVMRCRHNAAFAAEKVSTTFDGPHGIAEHARTF